MLEQLNKELANIDKFWIQNHCTEKGIWKSRTTLALSAYLERNGQLTLGGLSTFLDIKSLIEISKSSSTLRYFLFSLPGIDVKHGDIVSYSDKAVQHWDSITYTLMRALYDKVVENNTVSYESYYEYIRDINTLPAMKVS